MSVVVVSLVGLAVVLLSVAVALGWVPDTRQPGRLWYPAGPDSESWRVEYGRPDERVGASSRAGA